MAAQQESNHGPDATTKIERVERLELVGGLLFEAIQGPDGRGHVRMTSLQRIDTELSPKDIDSVFEFLSDVRRIGSTRQSAPTPEPAPVDKKAVSK